MSAICSGVDVNADHQCLTPEGEVIEGLYAIGNCSGGFYGGIDYPLTVFGLSLGRCYTEGYVIGRMVAEKQPTPSLSLGALASAARPRPKAPRLPSRKRGAFFARKRDGCFSTKSEKKGQSLFLLFLRKDRAPASPEGGAGALALRGGVCE